MVAPIDAKAQFEVEGETITLRLNFRALALAKKKGVDLLAGKELDPLEIVTAVRCLAIADHPEMTDEEAFAIVIKGREATAKAMTELFSEFGGQVAPEGNGPKRKK